MWWIRAAIQEYILHSWSLVKMGTTAAQKKLFFNLRKLKGQMQAIEEGDLSPESVKKIATTLEVPEDDVVVDEPAPGRAATIRSTRRCAPTSEGGVAGLAGRRQSTARRPSLAEQRGAGRSPRACSRSRDEER